MNNLRSDLTYAMPMHFERLKWQDTIFADSPSRLALMKIQPDYPLRELSVCVSRNTTFELLAEALPPFLGYSGLSARYAIGAYDDTLNFSTVSDADINIIWLDYTRYAEQIEKEIFLDWLKDRLHSLRKITAAPILINTAWRNQYLSEALVIFEKEIPGLKFFDIGLLEQDLGENAIDARMNTLGAMQFSAKGITRIAQYLGLQLIPSAIFPRLKAVAVDFDNTIYSGVLGEDGIQGVELTPQHKSLQEKLVKLHQEGMFLVAVSKNELEDVEKLLDAREDFPLKRDHFSAMAVSWGSKGKGISKSAEKLRIGTDAFLFLDDNMGELNEVSALLLNVQMIHASSPENVLSALSLYPALSARMQTNEDSLRAADLAAADRRQEEMSKSADPYAYLKSLHTEMTFRLNMLEDRQRLYELSSKTNQFNMSISRFSEAAVQNWLTEENKDVVCVSLKDDMSDSGIIAVLFIEREDAAARVCELCISCRALGRKLEDRMVFGSLEHLYQGSLPAHVIFEYRKGPRNGPALNWLENISHQKCDKEAGSITIPWSSIDAIIEEKVIKNER